MLTDPATILGLKVTELACVRGEARLFQSLSFSLAPGEGLFVRGANGAGKSTLLKLLAGLLTPQAGEIAFAGQPITADLHRYRRHIAYLGHLDGLKPNETPRQALGFLGQLRSHAPVDLALVGMQSLADTPIRYLSAGQRRRVALAGVLASNARLWLLDEPTTALDENGARIAYEALRSHLAGGGIFVVATHDDPPTIDGAATIGIARS